MTAARSWIILKLSRLVTGTAKGTNKASREMIPPSGVVFVQRQKLPLPGVHLPRGFFMSRGGKNFKDHTGQRFGRLVVVERVENNRFGHARWACRCDCGSKLVVASGSLRSGNTKSCGCLKIETDGAKRRTHGLSCSRGPHPTYSVWANLRKRCNNENCADYKYYGGRGITVCPEWDSFENFLRDMGTKPSGMSIDRIDNDKGYSPENCRWATTTEQNRNSRKAKLTLWQARKIRTDPRSPREIAEEYGISQSTVSDIRRGKIWKEPSA